MVLALCHCDSRRSLDDMAKGDEQPGSQPALAAMEAAVGQLLVGVGEDPAREGLIDTPRVSGDARQAAAAAWMARAAQ